VAGLAVVRLGPGGALRILSSAQTDVLVDLVGFLHPTLGTSYHPLDPVRIFDTRPWVAPAGWSGAVMVRGARGVIPGTAAVTGAILNVTAVGARAAGFLTVYPGPCDPSRRPAASTLNFAPGGAVANLVLVPVGSDGTVCVHTSQATSIVVDAAGWTGAGGSRAWPISAQRLVDTRTGAAVHRGIVGPIGPTPVAIPVGPGAGVPATASAVVVDLTVVGPAGDGWLVAYPCDQGRPKASSLNFRANELRSNLAVVRVDATDRICVISSALTHVVVDLAGWFA
jgi:hypothetical protein